jgi:predicted phosphodiesterase
MEKQGCQLVVGVGDYSYTEEPAGTWFNKIMGPRWKGKMKGCIGNHDVHDPSGFLREFGQTGWNVAAKVAPSLTVVFIDTEKGIAANLLESLTSAAKSQSKFVVYVFHKPYITSANGHHKPSENKWSSIIDAAAKKHGVKLLIAGHNHLMEHFKCGEQHYVTSGAAGRKFYAGNCQNSCGPVKCVENTNGFLKVAAGNTLTCQFISNSGQTLDSFQIA